MKKIAIVENDDQSARRLISCIERYGKENGQEFDIIRFENALDFLCAYKSNFAVIFMDIQMPKMDGMSGAAELRKIDKTVSLIFVTSFSQYAQCGYEVDAAGFLIKPVGYYDFSLKFDKALDLYALNADREIIVNIPNGICRISTNELMYVEIMNHRLRYHLVDDVIEKSGSLSEAEKELRKFGFIRCNKCYLVNPKFVVSVKGSNVVVGNHTLQLSRPRRSAFLAELADWYAGNR